MTRPATRGGWRAGFDAFGTRFGALAALAPLLLVGACAGPPRPVAVVTADQAVLRLAQVPPGPHLDAAHEWAVVDFLQARFPGRRSGLHVHVAGPADRPLDAVARVLIEQRVPPDNVSLGEVVGVVPPPPSGATGPYRPGVPYKGGPVDLVGVPGMDGGVVTLTARLLDVLPPRCDRHGGGPFAGTLAGRGPLPALGCTSDAALAAMIADPGDLLGRTGAAGLSSRGASADAVLPAPPPPVPTPQGAELAPTATE